MGLRITIVAVVALALVGCSKSTTDTAASPAATVRLKDGSTFSGSVTSSDSTAITLKSDTGETRTYPMSQVAAVNYASPSAAAPGGAAPGGAGPAAASNEGAPAAVKPMAELQPTEVFKTIPAGATLRVRNNQTIDSQVASDGQTFPASMAETIDDGAGNVIVPKGADATLVVRDATGQGKLQGQSELVLDLESLVVDGRTYRLETQDIVQKGKEGVGTNKRTAKFAGGGAALGGIIGAIAGGGKGAAIGALSGAAAGTGAQAVTRGKAVRVPAETVLSFKLEQPVRIREMQ
jgi:hypothetical protein